MEAPPTRGFSEEQFRAACRELDQPAPVAPWQLLVESMGVRIYRLYDEVGGRGSSPTPQRVAGPRALPGRARSEEAGPGPGGRSGAAPGAAGAAGGAAESRRPRLDFAVLPASSLPSNAIKCCRGKPLCRGELQVRQRPGSGWLLRRPGGEGKPLPAHLRQDLPAPRLLPLSKTPSELNFSPFCP